MNNLYRKVEAGYNLLVDRTASSPYYIYRPENI
jgi:hypothetical protein